MAIANLPTELIFEVAKYLGDQDASQIRMAVTCRRFHEVLMGPKSFKASSFILQTLTDSFHLCRYTVTDEKRSKIHLSLLRFPKAFRWNLSAGFATTPATMAGTTAACTV